MRGQIAACMLLHMQKPCMHGNVRGNAQDPGRLTWVAHEMIIGDVDWHANLQIALKQLLPY